MIPPLKLALVVVVILVVIDEVFELLSLKFKTGLNKSDKSTNTSPLDSVVFKIPSLSISKSMLSKILSESKSGGQSETVISLDSKYCVGSEPHCF